MRVLFDITHPVNAQYLTPIVRGLLAEGHEVRVATRDKDRMREMVSASGIRAEWLSRKTRSVAGLPAEFALRVLRLHALMRRFRPQLVVASEGGVFAAPSSMAAGVPCLVFDQADVSRMQQRFGSFFATRFCVCAGYRSDKVRCPVQRLNGFFHQAYLDPRRFTPDPARLSAAGVDFKSPYSVLRLVRWAALHDVGRNGTPRGEVDQMIQSLERFGRVFISAEYPLPAGWMKYANPLPADHFMDLLAFAGVCVAEGGTVAAEAAVLGTPSVSMNAYDLGYLDVMERDFGLVVRARNAKHACELAEGILSRPGDKSDWLARRRRLFERTDDMAESMKKAVYGSMASATGAGGP